MCVCVPSCSCVYLCVGVCICVCGLLLQQHVVVEVECTGMYVWRCWKAFKKSISLRKVYKSNQTIIPHSAPLCLSKHISLLSPPAVPALPSLSPCCPPLLLVFLLVFLVFLCFFISGTNLSGGPGLISSHAGCWEPVTNFNKQLGAII